MSDGGVASIFVLCYINSISISVKCLPLTREVDFAQQKTEGEIMLFGWVFSLPPSLRDTSLVRGRHENSTWTYMRFLVRLGMTLCVLCTRQRSVILSERQ